MMTLKDHTQPKCIAGEHCTGAIFCNTDKTFFPIVFDHRTISLQSAETGFCRWLLDVLWEYIVCTLCIFGSFPSSFTNMKRSNRGRPPRKESRHVIRLTTSTLKLWNERKRNLGFTNKSNSVFAEALLHGIVPREENEATSRSESTSQKNQQARRGRKRATNVVNASPMPCKSNYFVSDVVWCCRHWKLHVYTKDVGLLLNTVSVA